MADGEVGHVLTAKVGPLPLVLWVVGGASVIFVVMLMKNKGSSGAQGLQTNQVSALAPNEAEAFGTIEQQQQDVTNALTTLGNNQSALGGSMSTLTGIVTQQGADNAASFQNLQDGQNTIEAGQTSAANASSNYYSSLLSNLTNYFNSLSGSIGTVSGQVTGVSNQVNSVSSQVNSVSQQALSYYQNLMQSGQLTQSDLANIQSGVTALQSGQQLNTSQLNSIGQFLGWQFYQLPNRYTAYLPGASASNPNANLNTATMF
jgi:hypothetical protein